MTIEQLIAELMKYPRNAVVVTANSDDEWRTGFTKFDAVLRTETVEGVKSDTLPYRYYEHRDRSDERERVSLIILR